jgi:tetratricopeptide (TPR) repeat protein
VLWLVRLPGRRSALALVAAGAVALGAVAAVPPLRARVLAKGRQVLAGPWNRALTGRLDGWHAAVWMIGERPLAGVGQGAYSAEFATAKLALAERGTRMYGGRGRTMFVNAHNEPLEAVAEWGLPGAVALGWALWLLVGCLRRAGRSLAARGDPGAADPAARTELALAWGATAALAVLALVHFPFRLGAVAFPALLLLAWVFRLGDLAGDAAADPAGGAAAESGGGRSVAGRWLVWPALALAVAALALQTVRARDLLEASRILRQVEQVSVLAASSGRPAAAAPIYWANLKLLQRAERLAPADSRLPLARGSQYLLLGRPEEAMAAYRQALEVGPRPEIYLNLGRAALGAGEAGEARTAFRRALTLDRFLRDQVPVEMRPAQSRRRLRSPAR